MSYEIPKQLYACSICVHKRVGSEVNVTHVGFAVDAISLDEAIGKSFRIAYKIYPTNEGWEKHHAVCQVAIAVNPDTAIFIPY
jgi:hypothetical protein